MQMHVIDEYSRVGFAGWHYCTELPKTTHLIPPPSVASMAF